METDVLDPTAVLFRMHPRPWSVVDEGHPGGWNGPDYQDGENDFYVIDGFGEVVAQIGDDEDGRARGEGLVNLAVNTLDVPKVPIRVLGHTSDHGYVEYAGRLLATKHGAVEVIDLKSYSGNVEAWLTVNGSALTTADGPASRQIVSAVIDAGYDAADPIQVGIDECVASGAMTMREWTPIYVAILNAISDAAEWGENVAIVIPVPQAFADLADANCDVLAANVRVVAHPEQAPDGYRILHLPLPE